MPCAGLYRLHKGFLIRIGKEEITNTALPDFNSESNMILTENEFDYIVLLSTMKNSKDYLKFLESFGEASVNFRKYPPSDTLYKYEGKYKLE